MGKSHVDKNNAILVDTNETIPEGTPWSQSQRPGVCLQLKLQCTSVHFLSTRHLKSCALGTSFSLEVLLFNFCWYFRQGLALLFTLVSNYKVQVILLPQPPEELTAQRVLPYPVWIFFFNQKVYFNFYMYLFTVYVQIAAHITGVAVRAAEAAPILPCGSQG